jgi:predicted TIM-barrel fold metal-dependent hydrolase
MPRLVDDVADDGSVKQYWVLEGRAHGQQNVGLNTSKESREMADVGARLKHMDDLEIDVQVLYPSLFLRPLTHRTETEIALCQSYNRWMADIWSQGKGRLRWAAVLPFKDMDATLKELAYAHDHGACAVFARGIEEDMTLDNPYFYPLYAAVSERNIPIGIHAGNNSFFWNDMFFDEGGYSRAKLPVISAFHVFLMSDIATRFPKLRIGFIEAASQWIPGAVHDMARRMERRLKHPVDRSAVMREHNLFVACQTDDDLPYVLKYAGEDNLVVGTDYGHNDTATEIEALRYLRTQGEVSPTALSKILGDNAEVLYGL